MVEEKNLDNEPSEISKIVSKDKQKYSAKEILLGKVSKEFMLKRWLGILTPIFFVLILISYLLHPEYYSIFIDSISFLGDWEKNPIGWVFLSIAMVVGGVTIFPLVLYYHRRLVKICPYLARWLSFWGLVSAIGMINLSWLADVGEIDMWGSSMAEVHGILAGIALGLLALNILFYGFIYLKDAVPKFGGKQQVNWKLNLIPYGMFLTAFFGMAIFMGIGATMDLGWPQADWPISLQILCFPFWEWMVLFGLYGYLIFNTWVIPEDFDKY